MQLTYISITNYRSITEAYKLDLSDLTVLVGKNNTGKTNIIRAINIGMEVLNNMELLHKRRKVPKSIYDWNEDFPITLQNSRKLKNKNTTIRMDFTLSEDETKEFQHETNSLINGNISIFIKIGEDNKLSVTVPKRGKNAGTMTDKIVCVSEFLCSRFGIQYIPAVRSENEAYSAIISLVEDELISVQDEKYQEAMEYIEKVQGECLESLSKKVKEPLNTFLPEIKSIDLYKVYENRRVSPLNKRNVEIDIDDGVRTSLANKGDGVKSLVTMALLSQLSTKGQRLIIVDEPENHLHPEAVHYIDRVLREISSIHQVLISTHNPIFVNRNSIASNLIVDCGRVVKANRVEDIRSTLGVACSDNLLDADYIIIVEGESDKSVITKCILEDEELREAYNNKSLVVQEMGGTHNLKSAVYLLQQLCCNYMVLLDYDSSGKEAASKLKNEMSIPVEKIRHFMKSSGKETELEDLYKKDLYRNLLMQLGVDVEDNVFKNETLKWSTKVKQACQDAGIEYSNDIENNLKKELSCNKFCEPIKECLTEEGYHLISNILAKVKRDIMNMVKQQ